MAEKTSKPGKIHLQIMEVMKRSPDGITGGKFGWSLKKRASVPKIKRIWIAARETSRSGS
jgi:hypothetical protein